MRYTFRLAYYAGEVECAEYGSVSNPDWGKTQTNDRTATAAKEQPQPTAERTSMTVSTVYAIAIVSYLSLVGWVVAVILHYKSDSRNTSFGAFHLRQSLGIHLTGFFLGLPPLIIRAAGGEDFAWLISVPSDITRPPVGTRLDTMARAC